MRRVEAVNLQERLDDLREERIQIAEKVSTLDEDNPLYPQKVQRGITLDKHISGLCWAVEEAHEDPDVYWTDEPAEMVTVGGLTGGEYGRVQSQLQQDGDETPDAVYHVVAGVEADGCPWMGADMPEEQRFATTGALPIDFLNWVESVVDEKSQVGEGNGQTFGDLVAEMQSESTEE